MCVASSLAPHGSNGISGSCNCLVQALNLVVQNLCSYTCQLKTDKPATCRGIAYGLLAMGLKEEGLKTVSKNAYAKKNSLHFFKHSFFSTTTQTN